MVTLAAIRRLSSESDAEWPRTVRGGIRRTGRFSHWDYSACAGLAALASFQHPFTRGANLVTGFALVVMVFAQIVFMWRGRDRRVSESPDVAVARPITGDFADTSPGSSCVWRSPASSSSNTCRNCATPTRPSARSPTSRTALTSWKGGRLPSRGWYSAHCCWTPASSQGAATVLQLTVQFPHHSPNDLSISHAAHMGSRRRVGTRSGRRLGSRPEVGGHPGDVGRRPGGLAVEDAGPCFSAGCGSAGTSLHGEHVISTARTYVRSRGCGVGQMEPKGQVTHPVRRVCLVGARSQCV